VSLFIPFVTLLLLRATGLSSPPSAYPLPAFMPFLVQQPTQAALTHVLLAFHHCLHAYRSDSGEDVTPTGA
jgi:hypothetical protein